MIRFFKITTWTVIILSICFLFFLVFLVLVVDTAMGNPHDLYETGLPLLYWTALPVSLILTQSRKYKNRFTTIIAGILLLLGIVFCVYEIYCSYIQGFWQIQYLISFIPLILLLIACIGLIKKKI